MAEARELSMEVIVNPKHLERGVDVIQLETAAGAAIKCFKGACGEFKSMENPETQSSH